MPPIVSVSGDVVMRPVPGCDLCRTDCPDSIDGIIIHICENCNKTKPFDAVGLRNLARLCGVYNYPEGFEGAMLRGSEFFVPLFHKGCQRLGIKLLASGIDDEMWKRWCTDPIILNAVLQIMVAYALVL